MNELAAEEYSGCGDGDDDEVDFADLPNIRTLSREYGVRLCRAAYAKLERLGAALAACEAERRALAEAQPGQPGGADAKEGGEE